MARASSRVLWRTRRTEARARELHWKPLLWLGTLRPTTADDAWDPAIRQTFFSSTFGGPRALLSPRHHNLSAILLPFGGGRVALSQACPAAPPLPPSAARAKSTTGHVITSCGRVTCLFASPSPPPASPLPAHAKFPDACPSAPPIADAPPPPLSASVWGRPTRQFLLTRPRDEGWTCQIHMPLIFVRQFYTATNALMLQHGVNVIY